MSQQLESELREVFALKASAIPTQAGERLHGIDYRPRTGRTLPRVTVASLAGVAATTGVVASVVILGSSQPAFAGWSPSPTPASAVQTASAESACQAQLSAAPARPDPASAGASHPSVTPIATDVRGPFTLVIYESGATDESCLSGPTITMVSRNSEDAGHASGSMSVSGRGRAWAWDVGRRERGLDQHRSPGLGKHHPPDGCSPQLRQPGSFHAGRRAGGHRGDRRDPPAHRRRPRPGQHGERMAPRLVARSRGCHLGRGLHGHRHDRTGPGHRLSTSAAGKRQLSCRLAGVALGLSAEVPVAPGRPARRRPPGADRARLRGPTPGNHDTGVVVRRPDADDQPRCSGPRWGSPVEGRFRPCHR